MVQSKHQLPQLTHRRTVDCTNCVVIMTSNLGSEHLMAMAGDAGRHGPALEKARSMVLQTIRRSLRPELLNRLDDVIVFSPLNGDVLRQVVRLQLADVVRRLDELEVTMHITDAAVDRVLKAAHDPEMGARPLKRYMERHLVSRLSTLVLEDKLPAGSSVTIDWKATGGRGDWEFDVVSTLKRQRTDEHGYAKL